MKERIYTIPLTEAMEENRGCVLCTIEKKLEEDALRYFTGAAMMEPDVRILTNAKGFCARHYGKMLERDNKLSPALMMQTRSADVLKLLETDGKKKFFGGKSRRAAVSEALKDAFSSCAACERISGQLAECAENFSYLLSSEADFAEKYYKSGGMCMKHFIMCLESMSGSAAEKFIDFQTERLKDDSGDNDRFILKFDYRNSDMPWGNAKDAPKRLSERLRGR